VLIASEMDLKFFANWSIMADISSLVLQWEIVMDKIQFITYKGKKVLIEDFTNTKPGDEFLTNLQKAQAMIAGERSKSVLALFDASGASFNGENLSAMKKFTETNTPYIKAAAVVGITGMLKIALTSISKFSGREFITFATRKEALEWLIRQI
jgi:hypothetical protein